jgi:hypothetical protein
MFSITRRTALITRRLLDNDKNIGKRGYIVNRNEWASYCKDIVETYKSPSSRTTKNLLSTYNINDVILDTISNQTEDIKYIRLELMELNNKIEKLMNSNCLTTPTVKQPHTLPTDSLQVLKIGNKCITK